MRTLVILLSTPILALAQATPPAPAAGVTIYGVVDAGVVLERGCQGNCPGTRLSPGVAEGSRIGIRGREPLGKGDTVAIFTLEGGVENDTGRSEDGRLLGRQAWVGLESSWGALTLGRQYNLQYEALAEVADPFHGGLTGTATNLMGYTLKRYDNAVKYRSPAGRRWQAGAIYSFGESDFSTARNRAYGAMLGYADGTFNLRIAHQRKNNPLEAAGVAQPVDLSARNTLIAANVNFGMATVYAAYSVNRGIGSSPWDPANPVGALALPSTSPDSRDMLAGVSLARGRATYMLSVIRKNDRSPLNQDADQAAVGMSYSLSRRTALYASLSNIRNRHGANYTAGTATERGKGSRAIAFGMRHAF